MLPVVEYTHEETGGCSVIGGQVYTGDRIPALRGHYFYSDLCAGFLRSLLVDASGELLDQRHWTEDIGRLERVLEVGRDAAGELYVTEQAGSVHRVVPTSD